MLLLVQEEKVRLLRRLIHLLERKQPFAIGRIAVIPPAFEHLDDLVRVIIETRRMLSEHLCIDNRLQLTEHTRTACKDHLLRALGIALDEIETRNTVRFHEVIERINGADDLIQTFLALTLSLIALFEIVRIGNRTQRCRLVRCRYKECFRSPLSL